MLVKLKPSSEAQHSLPVVTKRTLSVTAMLQKLQWDSLPQRRAHSRVLMLYHIHNGLVAIPASAYLQPATAHIKGSETSYRQIQCNTNTYSHTFLLTAICLFANCRQTSSKLNWTQSSWCKCLSACFRFTHLDPLTAVQYYSTWVGTYLEEEELEFNALTIKLLVVAVKLLVTGPTTSDRLAV